MHRRYFLASVAAAAAITPSLTFGAPAARAIAGPWAQTGAGMGPDHSAWADILAAHVKSASDGVNRFEYGAADLGAIRSYIASLETIDPTSLSREAAFAYWANAYNAVTVAEVVAAYPVDSIRDIDRGLFGGGPWGKKTFTVLGQQLSLDDIEHGIMRPVFRDPRVHYAVNCASIGCPNLRSAPWQPGSLNADLDAAARDFVNHPRGAQISNSALTVSSIYDWFKDDFGGNTMGVIAHLRQYAAPDFAAQLATTSRIAADRYDWSLNDA